MLNFFLGFITIFTFVYFLTFILLKQGLKNLFIEESDRREDFRKVSIIVSARNESKNLPKLFHCLENQKTDNISIEFIIVNDRSEDHSYALLKDRAVRDKRYKIINITDRIEGFAPKKRAIDLAINEASGDIILLTDADGRPGPKWVQSYYEQFCAGADMVIGYAPYIVDTAGSLYKKMLALEYFSHAAIAAATTGLNFPLTCVGTNMAYLKKVYQEIDGFGEYKAFISGDDDLFLTRVREQKKYKIRYAVKAESQVWNAPPASFKQFLNQRLRYASKGFNYPFKVTIVLSFYVLYNLLLFLGPFLAILNPFFFWFTLLALLIKMLTEYSFISKAVKTLSDTRFTKLYFLTSLLHIPYVLFFGIAGQFKIFKWAEKKAEFGISKSTSVENA